MQVRGERVEPERNFQNKINKEPDPEEGYEEDMVDQSVGQIMIQLLTR